MNFEFISAAESHYRAIMDKSALTMKIYMNSSMGVGEHPQVFDEFIQAFEEYKEARECFQLTQELKAQLIKEAQDKAEQVETSTEDED
tara:strand:- start:285 stop:548 length:264 start_codon:yes stop_codon:yes gene_type:complete